MKSLQSAVFSRQPVLSRVEQMSGSAVQVKQLQRFPHAC